MGENGQRCLFSIKTVGRVNYRYRLVHLWVAEMLLNVQSGFSFKVYLLKHKAIYIYTILLYSVSNDKYSTWCTYFKYVIVNCFTRVSILKIWQQLLLI